MDQVHSYSFEAVLTDDQLTDDQLSQIGMTRDPEYIEELPVAGEYDVYWFGDIPAVAITHLTLFGTKEVKYVNLPLTECNIQDLVNKIEESGFIYSKNDVI